MAPPPKALIFDLDGVLVDSEPLHRMTWRQCFEEERIPLAAEDEHRLQGRTGEQILGWLKNRPQTLPENFDFDRFLRRKRELFREKMQTELAPVPGVDAFLRKHKSNRPLGLVTSAKLKTVGQIMLIFNWRNIFDALVGAEHVVSPKPHPEPYLHVAHRFKLDPAECLVFEDSAVGIESARGAGMTVCGVSTTLPPAELRRLGAHWVIPNFLDEATLELALTGHKPGKIFGWLAGLSGR
ncbi:HAD family phosphatase [Candidatus Sumerlaeota bacterium]|nr:HAD family phosphatase [Candidatus Sumerlaeota bacterium]MBI3736842.1 HAD family phosphatase [Candidatus Sumerlaeota bacterium]